MTKRSKRYRDQADVIDKTREHPLREALEMALDQATANFAETIECHVRLNIDPSKADQQIRGSIVLPAGTGRDVRIAVFARGEKAQEAEEAGADVVGGEDLIERIQEGWLEFDEAVATPDMMSDLSALGPTLGPRGLMPSNKAGTVTFELADTIDKLRKGQVELRTDSYGIIHTAVGIDEMNLDDLEENLRAILRFIVENRPEGVKGQGQYFRSIALTPSMGPSIKVDPTEAWGA